MKYERLTQKGKKWIESNHDEVEAYNRLCELEDKIERGELVENTVVTYVNMGRSGSKTLIDKALKFDALKAKIENGKLVELGYHIRKSYRNHDDQRYKIILIDEVEIDKIGYDGLTEAEAKAKLEELKVEQ